VLAGDINRAFKYTIAYYPNVLKPYEPVYFRLGAQEFIGKIRRAAEQRADVKGQKAELSAT
jgi:Ran-binding protein 9/10